MSVRVANRLETIRTVFGSLMTMLWASKSEVILVGDVVLSLLGNWWSLTDKRLGAAATALHYDLLRHLGLAKLISTLLAIRWGSQRW